MSEFAGLLDSPIKSVLLVEKITRAKAGKFRATSPPGHLLHLVLSGKVRQYADDRRQQLTPGSLVWYHQMEAIEGTILQAPWEFITINFIAPALTPPADHQRVRPARSKEAALVRSLFRTWNTSGPATTVQAVTCFALLHQLLAEIMPGFGFDGPGDNHQNLPTERWWSIEKEIRQHLEDIPPLPELARRSGLSLRTLVRACIAATGIPPARRIAMLRLTKARHLLQTTRLPVSEIALHVGYPRVQELSRAMQKYTHQTPSEVRTSSPDYRQASIIVRE